MSAKILHSVYFRTTLWWPPGGNTGSFVVVFCQFDRLITQKLHAGVSVTACIFLLHFYEVSSLWSLKFQLWTKCRCLQKYMYLCILWSFRLSHCCLSGTNGFTIYVGKAKLSSHTKESRVFNPQDWMRHVSYLHHVSLSQENTVFMNVAGVTQRWLWWMAKYCDTTIRDSSPALFRVRIKSTWVKIRKTFCLFEK